MKIPVFPTLVPLDLFEKTYILQGGTSRNYKQIRVSPRLQPLDLFRHAYVLHRVGTFGNSMKMYVFPRGHLPWICLDMRMFYIGLVLLGTVWKCMYFQGGTSPGFDENIHGFFTKGIFKNCMQIRVFPRGRLLDLFGKVYILQGGTFRDCMNTLWIWLKIRAFS